MLTFILFEPNSGADPLVGLVFLILGLGVYFIPTIIAIKRNHPNTTPIILVNILLGGCFGLGWIVALVWSLTAIDVGKKYR